MNNEEGANKRKWGSSPRGFNRRGRGRGVRYNNKGPWGGRQNVHDQNQDHSRHPGNGSQNYNRGNQYRAPRRETPGKRLSEADIGVTEYVSKHEGFFGIIKSRYSDFQVSEINERGEVAKLTDTSPPKLADDIVQDDEDLHHSKYDLEILPMETWDSINSLAVGGVSDEKIEIDVSGKSKEQRTKIHEAVKKAFGASIVGSTVSTDDKKVVQFQKFRKGVRIDSRVKWPWPAEYVQFVVYKENCDTMEAAVRIADRLRVNLTASMLGYAGTKDRRAKTSQWFSLRKVDPRRIANACQQLGDVWLGNYSFSTTQLKLGSLQGNRFRIALRNVTVPDETVSSACSRLTEEGFINYYGLQRFGTRVSTPTFQIGLKLLQGKFKEAIAGILEEREGPIEDALRAFKEHGAGAAAALLEGRGRGGGGGRGRGRGRAPRGAQLEARLLAALARLPNDLLGALNKMARNTRLLYLHSYQSLVWNRCVSERLRRFGLKPAVGDLVPDARVVEEELDDRSDDEETDDDNATQDGGDNEHKMADNTEHMNCLETSTKDKQKVPVHALSQEDVDSGKYTMADIVLPLPGHAVEYSPNMVDYYRELLERDGLGLEMKHAVKSYAVSGAYRHVVVRPRGARWRCVRYGDPHADLIRSDRDEMEGRSLNGIQEDGKYKALLLTLSLPSSCYATMALRELLKVDTASDYHALHNNYHVDKKEDTAQADQKEDDATEGKDAIVDKVTEDEKDSKKEENGDVESESGEKRKLQDNCDQVEVKKLKQE